MQPWLDKNIGESHLSPDPPRGIDGQCVNAASSWSMAQGGPELIGATAWDIWQNFQNTFFERILPGGVLSPGDIVFYLPNNAAVGTGSAGHVDIATDSFTPHGFRGVDTDWNKSPLLQYVSHSFNGVAGWFHHGGNMSSTNLTKEEIEVIYQLAFLNAGAPDDFVTAYTGQPLDGLLQQLQADPTRAAMVARYYALQDEQNAKATTLAPGTYIVE